MDDCDCEGCKSGVDSVIKAQEDAVRKYGWYIHYVPGRNGLINAHTHNLEKLLSHPDLQIVAPLALQTVGLIFHAIVDKIKGGHKFEEGNESNDVLKPLDGHDMPISFMNANEGNRTVLRVIVPDKNGETNKFKIEPPFDMQFDQEDQFGGRSS